MRALFLLLVMTALCWITTVLSAPVTGVIQGGAARLSAPAGDFFHACRSCLAEKLSAHGHIPSPGPGGPGAASPMAVFFPAAGAPGGIPAFCRGRPSPWTAAFPLPGPAGASACVPLAWAAAPPVCSAAALSTPRGAHGGNHDQFP